MLTFLCNVRKIVYICRKIDIMLTNTLNKALVTDAKSSVCGIMCVVFRGGATCCKSINYKLIGICCPEAFR